jgi:hypothetical protein
MMAHVVSAARGKLVYNVESHLNGGGTDVHQRILDPEVLRADLVPQLGAGVKGFLFWQYRSETLGAESPGWGLVRADGSPRPATEAARRFWRRSPARRALRRARRGPVSVASQERNLPFCSRVRWDRLWLSTPACGRCTGTTCRTR